MLLCLLLALSLGGWGKLFSRSDRPPKRPAPDWVETGGRSSRYPDDRYVTGFAMAVGEAALEQARAEAAADLAARISVRIEHELRDVRAEEDGEYRYKVAAVTRSTADIRLTGLHYDTWETGKRKKARAYALAILERGAGAAHRNSLRDQSLAALRACLESGARNEKAGRELAAIETYETCRRPIAEALEHHAVARAVHAPGASERAKNERVLVELMSASRLVDDKIRSLLRRPVSSLRDAVDSLAIQLDHQGVSGASPMTVAAFTFGTTDLSSSFGRQVGLDLEGALVRRAKPARLDPTDGESPPHLVLRGIYLNQGDEIRLTATAKGTESARLVAYAETSLPRKAVPAGLALQPSNFEAALADQKILADGELDSSDLRLDLWTDRGRRGLVYNEAEELKLFLRVNQPAWVRLIYVLQNGLQVPLDHAYYVDESNANLVVEYPASFEVVPPFGVEHFHATAFSKRPERLATRIVTVEGVEYEVLADDLEEHLKRARGLKRKKLGSISEAFITVTTTPRR